MKKTTLSRYDVTLVPLTKEHIQLVRKWRNDPSIKKYARDQHYITKEAQEKWWKSKDNDENLYYLVEIDNKYIGLIWANNLYKRTETGFYIYDEDYQNSIYSYKVVTFFHEILFNKLKLEFIHCDIMHTNKRAIRFNTSLGYKNVMYDAYLLSKDDFLESRKRILPIIQEE